MLTAPCRHSHPCPPQSTGEKCASSAMANSFEAVLKDSMASQTSGKARPAVNATGPIQYSDYALKMMDLRGVDKAGLETFNVILNKAVDHQAYSAPKAFLKTLSAEEMEVLRQVHTLAEPITIDTLDFEGAYNLLLQPGDAKDLNNDGLLGVGIGKGWVFPPPNASSAVKKAWDEATADLTDSEKMLAETPFMTQQLSANIKYGSNGHPIGVYRPGESGYTNIFSEPGFSYIELVEKALNALEFNKNYNSTEHYQQTKAFLTTFLGTLEHSGVA